MYEVPWVRMKRLILLLAIASLFVYLLFTAVYIKDTSNERLCANFKVVIKDSLDKQFISAFDIEQLLRNAQLYPVEKQISSINTMEMEEAIKTNKLVKAARVYKTQNAAIIASIWQRKPVMRVISSQGASYYVDTEREIMPVSLNHAVYLPVATGYITEEFAKEELYEFVEYISSNPSWDAWIEQIVVTQNQKIQIIPRAGDFVVSLGPINDFEVKLKKLRVFMEKGLNVVGWNRYSEINLEYSNQVVCTLK